MSFKFVFFIHFLIFSGCGVKAKPLAPPDSATQSYIESYTTKSEEINNNKNDTH